MQWSQTTSAWLTEQWQTRGAWYWLTLPLAWLYASTVRLNTWLYQRQIRQRLRLSVPVIVVGNLYIGGTGKTPVTIALANALRASGYTPGLISRGYGSLNKALPATGQGAALDWRTFGDEPALIAQRTLMPVSVHANRFLAGRHLLKFDPSIDVIISDDGLQHQRLARDVELLVEDDRGLGNGATLPAGPLREPGTRRNTVDAILRRGTPVTPTRLDAAIPTFGFKVALEHFFCPSSGEKLDIPAMADRLMRGQAVPASATVAIAGIGVPERFFQLLRRHQITLDQTIALADHAPMTAALLASIDATTILVTEKDAVKYRVDLDSRIWVASAGVQWADQNAINWLVQKLQAIKTGARPAHN